MLEVLKCIKSLISGIVLKEVVPVKKFENKVHGQELSPKRSVEFTLKYKIV